MSQLKALKAKVDSGKAWVGIIGLGYVGLPLAVEFAHAGFKVVGVDVDKAKVTGLNKGRSHIEDVPSSVVMEMVRSGKFTARSEFKGCGRMDAIFIAVPTPLRKTRDPDISYIVAAVDQIARELRPGQLIVLESTTYPGTTEEIMRPRLEAKGLKVGKDFFLAFSPERVDPGNKVYDTKNTPKVVGGTTPSCTRAASMFYEKAISDVHTVSSTQTAEMIKLLENTFRAVNIGLVNEIAMMCEKLDLDVWEVIDGAATKPFGFMKFLPGPGIGGHCIPLDPHYLSWKLKTLNYSARFIELASEINSAMPELVVRRATELLNERRMSVKGARILILGVSYKRDTGDLRESPALDVLQILHDRGARIRFHDPYNKTLRLEDGTVKRGRPFTPATFREADLVIIVTDHSCFDFDEVVRHSKVILDTRNATRSVKAGRNKVHTI